MVSSRHSWRVTVPGWKVRMNLLLGNRMKPHVTGAIGVRGFGDVSGLVELLFEYDDRDNLAVDLERLQLGYTFSDEATVWLGRFHTPF